MTDDTTTPDTEVTLEELANGSGWLDELFGAWAALRGSARVLHVFNALEHLPAGTDRFVPNIQQAIVEVTTALDRVAARLDTTDGAA